LYQVTTYYSLTGLVNFVDLPNSLYGEWIIYDALIPKYHVNIFDTGSISNIQLRSLIDSKKETIESIIDKISAKENIQLSLGHKPIIEVIKKSELINLDLEPLPEIWVLNIS
jgi:hypothetical protein